MRLKCASRPRFTDVITGPASADAICKEWLYSQKQNQGCYSSDSHRVLGCVCLFSLVAGRSRLNTGQGGEVGREARSRSVIEAKY